MNEIHELAVQIVERFEDLLEKHGMMIPDDDRTGAEGEAPIYGVTWGNLVDEVTRLIAGNVEVDAPDEEGVCPVCGGRINHGCIDMVDEGDIYDWECPDCGAIGKEGYDLIFNGRHFDVKLADGRPFKREEQSNG